MFTRKRIYYKKQKSLLFSWSVLFLIILCCMILLNYILFVRASHMATNYTERLVIENCNKQSSD